MEHVVRAHNSESHGPKTIVANRPLGQGMQSCMWLLDVTREFCLCRFGQLLTHCFTYMHQLPCHNAVLDSVYCIGVIDIASC